MNKLNLTTIINRKAPYFFAYLIVVGSLSGCNTLDVFAQKNNLDNAVLGPTVAEQATEIKQQEKIIQTLIIDADEALNNGDYISAEQLYKEILTVDEHNLRAQDGLNRTAAFSKHQTIVEQAKVLISKTPDDKQAAGLLRGVLVENPKNIEAAKLYQTITERADIERIESMRLKLKYDKQVSLEFRDTQIKVIIEALAKGTGVNFMLDKDVKSSLKASLFIRDVPLENAIDMLVQSNQLRKKILSENSIIIYPDTPLKIRQYQDLIIRSFFLEYADPTKVSTLLKTMLGIKHIQTDDRVPMIMIKDVPEVMVLAEKLIKSQDIADPEVMLEMNILEVRRSVVTDQGVIWPTQLAVLSDGALTLKGLKSVASENLGVSPSPSLIFDGLDTNADLLANPRIRVKNKEKAQIHIGDRVPVITSNVSSNGVISDNVQYIDTGLKLEVEPEISMGGDVTIKLNLEVSSIGEKVITNTGAVVPQIGTRSTSTQLRLKDGETQVLAGLINDEERKTVNKIPGLGDLPILGRLFSKHKDDKIKTELILTITPHIIRPRKSPDAASSEYWMGTELQVGRSLGGTKVRTREEISKMFRPGTAPGAAKQPAASPKQETAPQGLNIKLPPGFRTSF